MTHNKRYEAHYDRMQDDRIHQAAARPRPATLPARAYGPEPIDWSSDRPPVWAGVQWSDRPAEQIAAFAKGWNDRVVVIGWISDGGERDTVVWRNAVTVRDERERPASTNG